MGFEFADKKISIDNKEYNIEVIPSNSDRVGYAKVKQNNIILRIPTNISREERFKIYKNLMVKITRYLKKHKDIKIYGKPKIRFYNNQNLEILNKQFIIQVEKSTTKTSKGSIEGNIIKINVSNYLNEKQYEDAVSNLGRRVISHIILPDFASRIEYFNSQFFKSKINKVRLKDNKSNWGSCSTNNIINLDFRLAFAPEKVRDAIIIHELAHTIHRNHSKQFWALVYSVMPDYKENKKWLRNNKNVLVSYP